MDILISSASIISLISDIIVFELILNHKKKQLFNTIAWIAASIALIFALYYANQILHANQYESDIICTALIFLCFFLYNNNFTQITFTFFSVWTISTILNSISHYISTLYFSFLSLQNQTIIRLIMFASIYTILILIIKLKWLENIKNVLNMFNRKFLIFTLFPIFLFSLFITIFDPYGIKTITNKTLILAVMFISVIIFAYYFVFATFRQIKSKTKVEERLKASQVYHSLQKDYYKALKNSIELSTMSNHNARHHLITIQVLLNSKKYDELNNYINGLFSNSINIELPLICENQTVNAIISHYIARAKKQNIKTELKISVPENINIDSLDLNIIFGNCLENAIEACTKLTDNPKYINIKAGIVSNYFVIEINNSFNGIVNIQNNVISSTNSNPSEHGIGLESVKTIVNRYNGTINFDYTGDEFITSIMLYNGPISI